MSEHDPSSASNVTISGRTMSMIIHALVTAGATVIGAGGALYAGSGPSQPTAVELAVMQRDIQGLSSKIDDLSAQVKAADEGRQKAEAEQHKVIYDRLSDLETRLRSIEIKPQR